MYIYAPTLIGVALIILYFRQKIRWSLYVGYGLTQLSLTLNMTLPMILDEVKLVKAAGVGLTAFGLVKIVFEVILIRHLLPE